MSVFVSKRCIYGMQKLVITSCVLLATTACTTLSKNDDPNLHVSPDSLEGFNRKSYAFNDALDRAILKPVASAYDTALPEPAKNGVGNFFANLSEPISIINNIFQGKVDGALSSTYRFLVNSTVGIFGLFDIADTYDVEQKPEDFGQTLAAWGVKPGPFIVIPFLGPSNVRDGVSRALGSAVIYPIDIVTDDAGATFALTVLDVVDTRAGLLGADDVLANQLDPYLFLKTAYESNRINQIYDGDPPEQSDDDLEF